MTEHDDDGDAVFLRCGGTGSTVRYPGPNVVVGHRPLSPGPLPKDKYLPAVKHLNVNIPVSMISEIARVFTL